MILKSILECSICVNSILLFLPFGQTIYPQKESHLGNRDGQFPAFFKLPVGLCQRRLILQENKQQEYRMSEESQTDSISRCLGDINSTFQLLFLPTGLEYLTMTVFLSDIYQHK